MPKMVFIERDGTRKEVEAPVGLSVMEIAHRNNIDIEGACEGSLACSTCHVIVEESWYERLAEASEDEEDMLDLAFDLQRTSRLGCQTVMTEELDGLTVYLPGGRGNMLLGWEMSLVVALKRGGAEEWEAYGGAAFVRQLADGALPEACFRRYLPQDYVFLLNFARAAALA